MKQGKVYLVGAGPGNPDLISVRAIECIAQADVIIYDRLLDDSLLDLAPDSAERIYVGKAAGKHITKQAEINRLLVEKAKEMKTVVRLKGGDPFILGRGGEEAEALEHHQIHFEIVPGISSAIAVPAYAGIPVTHRDFASSFAVITGHEDPGKDHSSIAWDKLATGVDTLIFLMGMQNLPQIVKQLVIHGRSPNTPIAVIKNGTRYNQQTVTGNLSDIVNSVKEHNLSAPAVIVIGEVVRLREKLSWFDKQILFGKSILVTRARHQASTLVKLLLERGANAIELPAIAIKAILSTKKLDQAISRLEHYDWIIFTSVNGVEAFFSQLHNLNLDTRALKNTKVGAIGPATASALKKAGIIPDYIPEDYTAACIISGLRDRDIANKRFLLPRADIADKELAEGIKQLGAEVEEVAVYNTVPAADAIAKVKQKLTAGEIDIITFTSSSTVSNLVSSFGEKRQIINSSKIACIGPKTASTAAQAGLRVDIVASEHTIPGLVSAIEQYFQKEMEKT